MNYNQNQEGTAQQSQTPAAAESYYQQTPQNNYQFRNNNYYAQNYYGMPPNQFQQQSVSSVNNQQGYQPSQEFQMKYYYGSCYMTPEEIQYVVAMSNNVHYENDSLVEDYYYIRCKEQEDTSPETILPVPAMPQGMEKKIKQGIDNMKRETIERSKLWSTATHTLGFISKTNIRTPKILIDLSSSTTDNEEHEGGLSSSHWKIMRNIENGFDILLEIDKIKRREIYQTYSTNNPASDEIKNYNECVMKLEKVLYLEGDNELVTVKTKPLLRLVKYYKGKKLLMEAKTYLSPFCWKAILSSLIPFILLWLDTRDQWKEDEIEVNENVVKTLVDVIEGPDFTMELLYDVLMAIVNSKTVYMIPDFLQTDPYSIVLTSFFNKGEFLSSTPSYNNNEEENLIKNKWVLLMDSLEQMLSTGSE